MFDFTFFLGAGASSLFKFPTTREFMDKASSEIDNAIYNDILAYVDQRDQGKIDIEKILWELENLKVFVNKLSKGSSIGSWFFTKHKELYINEGNKSSQLIGKLNDLPKDIDEAVNNINKIVYKTYWDRQKPQNSNIYTKIYDVFGPDLDFFTTNYDLSIEYNFWYNESYKELIYDGFQPKAYGLEWNKNGFKKSQVRLYKLHGSVNWRRGDDGLIYKTPQKEEHNRNAIIYPGFKGKPEMEPFDFLHKELEKKLCKTDILVAVGFSFRDEEINKIILRSLKQNDNLRLLIWNPTQPQNPFPKERVIYYKQKFNLESLNEFETVKDSLVSSVKNDSKLLLID